MNEEQKFFKLLRYSNELKINNKYLDNEDPEAFDTLLNFLVIIEDNLHYSEKQEYIKLTKDFLADQITADNFSYSFIAVYEGINDKLYQMQIEESLELANFLKCRKNHKLGKLLALVYGSCDSYSPDPDITMADEPELKHYAQILLVKLQEQ